MLPKQGLRFTSFGVLNRDPLVVHVNWYGDDVFEKILLLSEAAKDRKVIFLIGISWSVIEMYKTGALDKYKSDYSAHQSKYRTHKCILLANDDAENTILRQIGLTAEMLQHNAFIRPSNYKIKSTDTEPLYEAIYVARIEYYKRVHLIRNIKKICLIYAGIEKDCLEYVKQDIAHAVFPNNSPFDSSFRRLDRDEVTDEIAKAHVGLCLSPAEGAMVASTEYMLVGVPVVSTPALGGRHVFHDPRFWVDCDDNPESVAVAVEKAKNLDYRPAAIRVAAINRIMELRVNFLKNLTSKNDGDFTEITKLFLNIDHPFDRPPRYMDNFIVDHLLPEKYKESTQ